MFQSSREKPTKRRKLFKRYGLDVQDGIREAKIHTFLRKWFERRNIQLETRSGSGISVLDFEFYYKGCRVGVEVKGHSRSCKIRGLMEQIRRYESFVEILVIIAHNQHFIGHAKSVAQNLPKEIKDKIFFLDILNINDMPFLLTKKIKELYPMSA